MEICKLDSEDAIFQLANIGFWIQHTKIFLLGISKPFLLQNACTFLNKRLFLIFFLTMILDVLECFGIMTDTQAIDVVTFDFKGTRVRCFFSGSTDYQMDYS